MMQIAYISSRIELPKKPGKREKLHMDAIAAIAGRREHNRERAERMFAPEQAELDRLKQKLANLKK